MNNKLNHGTRNPAAPLSSSKCTHFVLQRTRQCVCYLGLRGGKGLPFDIEPGKGCCTCERFPLSMKRNGTPSFLPAVRRSKQHVSLKIGNCNRRPMRRRLLVLTFFVPGLCAVTRIVSAAGVLYGSFLSHDRRKNHQHKVSFAATWFQSCSSQPLQLLQWRTPCSTGSALQPTQSFVPSLRPAVCFS